MPNSTNEETVEKLRQERSNRSQDIELSFIGAEGDYNVKAPFPITTRLGRVRKREDGWSVNYATPPSDQPIRNENGMATFSCTAVQVYPKVHFSSRQEAAQFLLSEWFAGRVA